MKTKPKRPRKKTKPLTREEFHALPREEKARLIAADALEQIRLEKYIAVSQTWLEVDAFVPDDYKNRYDLQTLLVKERKSCFVCAVGACLASKARLVDEITVRKDDMNAQGHATVGSLAKPLFDELRDIFGDNTAMIEAAYECGEGYVYDSSMCAKVGCFQTTQQFTRAVRFGRKYSDNTDRLVAILKNIVTHGEFVP